MPPVLPPPHWRLAPDPQFVDGEWMYEENSATHTWGWVPLVAGTTPASPMPTAPPTSPPPLWAAGTPWPPVAPAPGPVPGPAVPPAGMWHATPNPVYVVGAHSYYEDPANTWGWHGPAPLPMAPPPGPPPGWTGDAWPPGGWPVGPAVVAPAPGLPYTQPPPPAAQAHASAHNRPSWLWPVLIVAALLIILLSGTLSGWRFGIGGSVNTGNPGAVPGAGVSASAGANGTSGGGTTNGNAAQADGSSTATAAPVATTTTAPAVAGPLGTNCNVSPVLPAHWAGMQLHSTANTKQSRNALWAISHPSNNQPGAQLADYAGSQNVASSDMIEWVRDARCDGMSSAIEVSQFIGKGLGLPALISAVDSQPGLQAYVVGMNDLGTNCTGLTDVQCLSKMAANVGTAVGLVHAHSSKPVWCLIDKMEHSQAQAFKDAGCARVIVVYLPWEQSTHPDLQVSLIPEAGALAQSVDADNATGGVQTFSWWFDDNADAVQLGFTEQTGGLPPVPQVHHMGQLFKQGGAVDELGINLEKSEDNNNRLGLCAAAIRAAVDGS